MRMTTKHKIAIGVAVLLGLGALAYALRRRTPEGSIHIGWTTRGCSCFEIRQLRDGSLKSILRSRDECLKDGRISSEAFETSCGGIAGVSEQLMAELDALIESIPGPQIPVFEPQTLPPKTSDGVGL
jgi:hypothetical protein